MCDDVAKLACHGQGHCHTVSSTMAAFLNPFCQVPRLFWCFGLACLRLGVWTGRDFDRNEKKLYGGIHRSRKTMWWTSEVSIFWSFLGCSLRLPGLTTMPKIRIFQQTYPFFGTWLTWQTANMSRGSCGSSHPSPGFLFVGPWYWHEVSWWVLLGRSQHGWTSGWHRDRCRLASNLLHAQYAILIHFGDRTVLVLDN